MSEKRSRYVDEGAPIVCFLPSCQHRFLGRCIRGSDGHYYCTQDCADQGRKPVSSKVTAGSDGGMTKRAAQIYTISECIDHCFAFDMWCSDFARHVDPDDMVMGLDRAFELVSDATRLHSFLALRKLDEFFNAKKSKPDDLIASDLGVDSAVVLGGAGNTFLTQSERIDINKGAAHLTEKLTLDPESEVGLQQIVGRSMPVFERLVCELRKGDTKEEAKYWLDKTEALLKHAREQAERKKKELAERGRAVAAVSRDDVKSLGSH